MTAHTTSWIMQAAGLDHLEPEALEKLSHLQPMILPRGHVLFRPGDHAAGFVLVLSGRVDVHLLGTSGRELLLYEVKPGETCIQTTLGLLGDEAYSGEAVAETDLSVVLIPPKLFQDLIASSVAFRGFVFQAFGQRLQGVTQMLERVAFFSIETRLAQALLESADGQGVITETHQMLAVRIGSSREVVSRRLEALKQRGILELSRGQIAIRNRDALQNLASC